MKIYEKPEIVVQTITTNEQLMAEKCHDETVVPRFRGTDVSPQTRGITCTFTKADS